MKDAGIFHKCLKNIFLSAYSALCIIQVDCYCLTHLSHVTRENWALGKECDILNQFLTKLTEGKLVILLRFKKDT